MSKDLTGQRTVRNAAASVILVIAATVPFVPGAYEFIRHGVPDTLLTGDGAALELRVLYAAHGAQFLGPYSRFGWSHPGPAFFYLALPLYEALGRRAAALNVFVFVANYAVVVALLFVSRSLRGTYFALAVAAVLAVYSLVGLPFLLANEWNPIFPILPFLLFSFLAVELARGRVSAVLPFAFIGSVIVQTHVAYAPEVVVLSVVAFLLGRRNLRMPTGSQPQRKLIIIATISVLIACWLLPVYEAMTGHPGNIQLLVAFFAPDNLAVHPWSTSFITVCEQLAVTLLALARTFGLRSAAPPWLPSMLGLAQIGSVLAVLLVSTRQQDRVLRIMGTVVVVEIATAVFAVRAIRGEIEFYLVAWVSVVGFMAIVTMIAWGMSALQRTVSRRMEVITMLAASLVIGLVIRGPVPRGSVLPIRDTAAEEVARNIFAYLNKSQIENPVVRLASNDSWPTAIATVLYLYKRGVQISVAEDWLFITGKPLEAAAGEHPGLWFGNNVFHEQAQIRKDLTYVTATGDVYVYLEGR